MTWEISPITPMIVRAVPFGLKPKSATREKNGNKKTFSGLPCGRRREKIRLYLLQFINGLGQARLLVRSLFPMDDVLLRQLVQHGCYVLEQSLGFVFFGGRQ